MTPMLMSDSQIIKRRLIKMIRDLMNNDVAQFNNLQILDFKRSKQVEIFIHNGTPLLAALGKNAGTVKVTPPAKVKVKHHAKGEYFYWYTFPLMNYYHCINDGLGPIYKYLELKQDNPDLKFMLNKDPRKIDTHPPFVLELLDLLDIEYEFSNENCSYERVYFADTLVQHPNGSRSRPKDGVYEMIRKLVKVSRDRYPDVTVHNKVYLSRRAHANPLNDRKEIIGEDNTVKRGITNEDGMVEILQDLGYSEVFGENYNLGEKISMFSRMDKYISTAGAGVTNILWRIDQPLAVGGIHSPGFPFPGPKHNRHICTGPQMKDSHINIYPGKVRFVNEDPNIRKYNHPWYIDNLKEFRKWAKSV